MWDRYRASGRKAERSALSLGNREGKVGPSDCPTVLSRCANRYGRIGANAPPPSMAEVHSAPSRPPRGELRSAQAFLAALALLGMTSVAHAAGGLGRAIDPAVYELMVFVIAIFVGYYVVWGVTPALHTPLMSLTNAISSVIVVGALLATGVSLAAAGSPLAKLLGFFALAMVSVNIFGGFLVTQRMLGMYKRKKEAKT
jgi:NAD(P) transhydrogenase subunit alpha